MARTWYAFARDDGMPGAAFVKRVNPRFGTPVWSILITSALVVLICLYAAAYSVVTSISTITLYLAYIIPVFLNWRNRRRQQGEFTSPKNAPWNLGRYGNLVNALAIGWTLLILVIFSIPPNELVFWTMLLLAGVMALYWALHARHHFHGPTKEDERVLQAALKAVEAEP